MFLFTQEELNKIELNYLELLKREVIVIDVRSQQEFELGNAEIGINIPLSDLQNHIPQLKQKQKPIITCCKSGIRAAKATTILKNADIEAYNGGNWRSVQSGINNFDHLNKN